MAALEDHLSDLRIAPLYRSPAESPIPQPSYLNTVAVGITSLTPEDLLAVTKSLEWRAGRRPSPRWSPRSLDIDVLLYGARVVDRAEMRIPHPGLETRRFALQPLVDLCPDWRLADGRTTGELLANLTTQPALERVSWD